MKNKKTLLIIIVAALAVKLFLFGYSAFKAPDAKLMPDTYGYMKSGITLIKTGTFARHVQDGRPSIETFRAPGYPLFLGVLHTAIKIPLNGIVLIQILLTVITALIVYFCARTIDDRLATMSLVIMLFDLPTTIFSLLLLSETLCATFLAIFMYTFVRYLKNKRLGMLIISGVALAAATYVRPIVYYLAAGLAVFILYAMRRVSIRKAVLHALLFFICVYSLLGAWQYRNFIHTRQYAFSHTENATLRYCGLYKSYARNTDPKTQHMGPVAYYTNTTFRCFLSLMTRPGTLKYFKSQTLKAAGKVIGYPWMTFWLIGFITGVVKLKGNIDIQFLSLVVLYIVCASILGAMWLVSSRFRVVMMPFIAIISSHGWQYLNTRYRLIKR